MNDRALPLLPMVVLCLLAATTFWLSRYVQHDTAQRGGAARHDPDMIVEEFTARKLAPSGEVQYVVAAQRMMHFPDDDSSLLEKVRFAAVVPHRPQIVAEAPTGRLFDGGDRVVMEGGVRLEVAAFGRTPVTVMKTPRLIVLPDEGIARSDEGVIVENAQGVMRAATFEFNTEKNRITMQRVKAVFNRAGEGR